MRPSPIVPIVGALIGALGGFAFYVFFGCDSG